MNSHKSMMLNITRAESGMERSIVEVVKIGRKIVM